MRVRVMAASWLVLGLSTAGAAAGCSLFDLDRSGGYYGGYDPSRNTTRRDAGTTQPRGLQPDFGPTVSLDDPPPPLSGGTLHVSRDGARVVAADPDRDQVYIVSLASKNVETTISLEPHDEPGRVVEDGDGRFHVALRRAGAVITIAIGPDGKASTERRKVCPAPRGLAFDEKSDVIVACEGGELMRLPQAGEATLLARLERDLRDVIVTEHRMFVSTFRSARILELSHEGALITSSRLPSPGSPMTNDEPMIAFRMIAAPSDDGDSAPVIVHEEASPGSLSTGAGGYYGRPREDDTGPCDFGAVVHSAITRGGGHGGTLYLPRGAVLPVDLATDGNTFAVIAAGNGHTRELPQLYFMQASRGQWPPPCNGDPKGQPVPSDLQLTAVAFRGPNAPIVQSRQPARLVLLPEGTTISLSDTSREDTGHAVFHSNAGVGAACASCHPEGGDDGHTWEFSSIGPRRTPSLRGTVAGTAPFHWDGDVPDIAHLADVVLSERMSGPELDVPEKAALESWLFAIPPPTVSISTDDATVARGKAVFERADVGCKGCHDKAMQGSVADVGSGGTFQIPSLVGVATRAPFMHDGCASTLRERFSISCGGSRHGKVSHLKAAEIDELIAYLESL